MYPFLRAGDLNFLKQSAGARLTQIERALKLDRFQTVDSLRMLIAKGTIVLRDRLYQLTEVE
jgi:hypothetical protein